MTGTLGFVLSLLVILGTRLALGERAFAAWGWRVPFLLSILLLALSLWIRLSMSESPVFQEMKAERRDSGSPLSEAFGQWRHAKIALEALFGLVAGFGVIWYTTQFYVLLFLTQTLKVDPVTANVMVVIGIVLASPFFVVFGALSDRIGRKWMVLTGILVAGLSLFPIFSALTHFANPALERALRQAPVVVRADPADCQFQFNPTGTKTFTSACDLAKARLVAASVNYRNEAAPAGTVAEVRIGGTTIPSFSRAGLSPAEIAAGTRAFNGAVTAAIAAAGYPAGADPAAMNRPAIVALVFLLVFLLAFTYGPVAALLIDLFPARIRYTGMSVPYHLGTGWFGGLTPAIAFPGRLVGRHLLRAVVSHARRAHHGCHRRLRHPGPPQRRSLGVAARSCPTAAISPSPWTCVRRTRSWRPRSRSRYCANPTSSVLPPRAPCRCSSILAVATCMAVLLRHVRWGSAQEITRIRDQHLWEPPAGLIPPPIRRATPVADGAVAGHARLVAVRSCRMRAGRRHGRLARARPAARPPPGSLRSLWRRSSGSRRRRGSGHRAR